MKYAVIGCGAMGSRRIQEVKQLGAGELVAFDLRDDRRLEAGRRFGVRTVATVEALVAEEPDAIFICVPPADHLWYLQLAVERRWDFMVEQPISSSLAGCEDIVRQVAAGELVGHVSCNKRQHQSVRRIRGLVEANTVGPILTGLVEIGEWLPNWHPYEPYTDYYPSRQSMGGGLDAVCELDWLIDLFGPVGRLAAFAAKRTSLDIDTNDVIQMLLGFESGPQLVLHTDMIQRPYAHRANFVGEHGSILWDLDRHAVRVYEAEGDVWHTLDEDAADPTWNTLDLKPGWEWVEPMYLEDARRFVERVQARDVGIDSLTQGIENLRIVLQAQVCSEESIVWERPAAYDPAHRAARS